MSGNTISSLTSTSASDDAVGIQLEDNGNAATVIIRNNSIDLGSVAKGVANVATASSVDATANYWATSAPGGSMSGSVSYSPWWKDAAMMTLEFTVTTSGGEASTTVSGQTTLTGTSTVNSNITVTADIPSGTTITASDAWDGTLAAPIASSTSLSISGSDVVISAAVEIGSSGHNLTFDKGVKLTFVGQAGKRVGWYNAAGTFTEITATCAANDQAAGDALAAGTDCKIDSGADLVVWTKHFSTFLTYTQTQQTTTSSGSGGGNGAPVGSSPTAPGTGGSVVPTGGSTGSTPTTPTTPAQPQGEVLGEATTNTGTGSTGGSGSASGSAGSGTTGTGAGIGGEIVIATSTADVATSTATTSNTQTAAVQTTGNTLPWWVWLVLGLIVAGGLLWQGWTWLFPTTPKQ